ncbi:MAG: OsmC family protein [Candidatus Omnitrophica bacterium]|nr:OsmC family protein [Candidatus Omnitrophota bacterium]MBU0880707.1 OsmC family protein [Candidatus Omnitrophota bacterium]MBU0895141.1 OsmC family protein [Candidatus Omnitrophota bacterium]
MYKVKVSNEGAYKFNVRSGDYEFSIDASGKGITPPDALLASVGSCIGVYIRKYVDGAKLAIKDFTVSVEADFGKVPPYCFRRIDVVIDLKGVELDERRKKAILEFIRNCPVHNTLKNNPEINTRLVKP